MTRGKPATATAPQEFELTFAQVLDEVRIDTVSAEDFVENVRLVAGATGTGGTVGVGTGDARGAHFVGVLADGLDFSGAQWGQVRITESVLRGCSAVEIAAIDARLERVELAEVRIGFADFSGASWEQVAVSGGKINELNLRYAMLKDVQFRDVKLGTLDLAHAQAERVSLVGCQLDELAVHGAQLQHVDLRGASIGTVVGVASLGGTIIDEPQLSALAPQFAQLLGISVR